MSMLSIVIPMFNEARHIGRTLQSAYKAAHAAGLECELIVVDNGSCDQGPEIARSLGAHVLSLPGLHIGALRNRGAAAASGDWLAFLDADIEVPPNWLTLLLELETQGHADVLALDCDTPQVAPWFARAWQSRTLRPRNPAVHAAPWLPTPNLLLRRQWFDRVGGFDESLRTGEDKDLTQRLRQAGARLVSVSNPVTLHWGYEGSWGEWLGKEMWRQGSHLQLLRKNGWNLRSLRLPMLSLAAWLLELTALSTLPGEHWDSALQLLLVAALPGLVLSLRQSLKLRNPLLSLQLWGLHWIRLHLVGVVFVMSLCNWNARRPARG